MKWNKFKICQDSSQFCTVLRRIHFPCKFRSFSFHFGSCSFHFPLISLSFFHSPCIFHSFPVISVLFQISLVKTAGKAALKSRSLHFRSFGFPFIFHVPFISFPFLLPFVSFYVPVVSSYFWSFPFLLIFKTAGRAVLTASSACFLLMSFSFPAFSVCRQFLLQIKTARRAALKFQVFSFPFIFTCFLFIILHSFLFKFFSCSFQFPLTFFYVCSLPLFWETAGRAALKSNAFHFLFISFHFSCHLSFPCVSVYVPSISLHFPFVFFSFCSFPF